MKKLLKIFLYTLPALAIIMSVQSCDEDDAGPQPMASFAISEQSVLKQGETISFQNTSESSFSYLWSFGDGQTFVGVDATHVYENPGDYEVTLEANGSGRRDLFTQTITIEGLVPSTAFSVENESDLKVALEVSFVNETVDGLTYLWEFGDVDNSTSDLENPAFTYSAPGDYTVRLTAMGTGGSSSVERTITVNPNNFELYFIDNDALKVKRIDLNNPTIAEDVFDLPGFSFGLTYDAENEEFYFSDDDAQIVYRNNLTGTAQTEIATGLSGPRDIALDIANDYIYVAERSADQITRIDLLDNSKTTLYSSADDANFLLPVGLDLHNGLLYATAVDIDAETIWTADLDGSGISRIIDFGAGGFGYGVTVDKVNDKIYFDNNDGNTILRADLDGSNIETVGTTSDRVYGIAINNETGKYYWVGRDGILYVANLDGSDQDIVVDLAADVRGLIIRKAE